jgi:hypothetical protein
VCVSKRQTGQIKKKIERERKREEKRKRDKEKGDFRVTRPV